MAHITQEQADQILQGLMKGYNDESYGLYSADFDEVMKQNLPPAVFDQTTSLIKHKLGDYRSAEPDKLEQQNQYHIFVYSGAFEKEDDVTIKLVLQDYPEDGVKVSGLWFDSPGLRAP